MKQYIVKTAGDVITVIRRSTGEVLAQYRGTNARAMRRELDKHLANPNSTLDNYQW